MGNLYLTEKESGDFTDADEEAVTILADWAAIAIRNSRLYSGVEDQRDELERAVIGLEATTEIAQAVGGETELDRVLELIAKRGRALIDAGAFLVMLTSSATGELEVAASAGEVRSELAELRVPFAGSIPGQVLESGLAVRFPDLPPNLMAAPRENGTGSASLLVPLSFRGDPIGVLIGLDRLADEPQFTAEDERVLRAFGASASAALATVQSVAHDRLPSALPPPSASAAAGPGNCTTTRCNRWRI